MTDRDQFSDFTGPAQPARSPLAEVLDALRALVTALDNNEGTHACRHNISLAMNRAEEVLAEHGGDR